MQPSYTARYQLNFMVGIDDQPEKTKGKKRKKKHIITAMPKYTAAVDASKVS